jgi:hypothetical protein
MEIIECPACAGPDNAFCATCNGTNNISQETLDIFNENKIIQEELSVFIMSIEDALRNSGTKEELIETISTLLTQYI